MMNLEQAQRKICIHYQPVRGKYTETHEWEDNYYNVQESRIKVP
jgi:hypothetical protein